MKIGIDAHFLQHPATGSGQYLLHLLAFLAQLDRQNTYLLLGSRQPEQSLSSLLAPISQAPLASAFSYQIAAVPRLLAGNKHLHKLAWEQWMAPAAAQRAGVDLYHIPYFAPPLLMRTPTVVTIHDVIPLRLAAYRSSARVKTYTALIARAAARADMIITVSEHARRDIMDALTLPPERVRVTYEAAGEQYRPVSDPAELARVRARYGLSERYVFYLGGLDQRKNVPQLVRAFARVYRLLGDPNLQLFISGDPDRQRGPLFPDPRPVAAELGITRQVLCRFVEEEDKPAVYSAASLFVFPSLYEGFGLPPLEALACGAPVVCSNRTSLPEVVGDAAITVDPQECEALAEAMHRVLAHSALQADLRVRALEQAAKFSWRRTAEETLKIYEEILVQRKIKISRKM
ncbi:MAG: glycosyltransferase family 4 protein [Ktedonobacteraceae bacterium]|nr:glycosyltransferase family 4 protein [Ktedonobacteraceae bacterium]